MDQSVISFILLKFRDFKELKFKLSDIYSIKRSLNLLFETSKSSITLVYSINKLKLLLSKFIHSLNYND